ncbi:MAG: diguanylate cyclase [Leptonema sp. (in: Bacteria)]|nr:diguanylate cyclase [Leptonema sp. (in: bacteria)]
MVDELSEMTILNLYASIGKLITSSLHLHDIIAGVMKEMDNFFQPTYWSLMRVDQATNELFFVAAKGMDPKQMESIRLQTGEGIAGHVVKTGQPIFSSDVKKDKRFSPKVDKLTGFNTKSIVAVPLMYRGTVYGVIELLNRYGGSDYTADDFVIIRTVADFAEIAFGNAAMFEAIQDQAYRDGLTGAYNRTRLNLLQEEWSGRRAEDQSCIVVIIDLDDFKSINDTYSHQAGDLVLQYLTQNLHRIVRGGDRIFRMGGDEFLILIQVTKGELMNQVKERIEKSLIKLKDQCLLYQPAFSFSYGIKSGSLADFTKIQHKADLDMYSRKKSVGA